MNSMTRREMLTRSVAGLAGAGLLSGMPACTGSAVSRPEKPERLIWITIDSLRADHLSFLGYERKTSPFMDELASKSVVFENTFAASDHTLRSVPSYMTGKYASFLHANMRDTAGGIPAGHPNIAGAFQQAGFKTFGWSTNHWVSERRGMEQGFDFFRLFEPINHPYARLDEVIEQIHQDYTPGEGQEMLYVHTMDVHVPYVPSMPFDTAFTDVTEARYVKDGQLRGSDDKGIHSINRYHSEFYTLEQPSIDFFISQYDGAILYTDDRMQKLLEVLHYNEDRDLLVIMADHGEQFFERGFRGHGHSNQSEETRVPLMFRWNGWTPARDARVCGLIDLFPTFCELFGLSAPEDLCGRSFAQRFSGGAADEPRTIFTESNFSINTRASAISDDYYYSVDTGVYKQRPWLEWHSEQLLFDRQADPACLADVLNDREDAAQEMNQRLRALNPRYDQWVPDRLTHAPGWTPALGDDVFAMKPAKGKAGWRTGTPVTRTPDAKRLVVRLPEDAGAIRIEIPESGVYRLAVDYTLQSGNIRLVLVHPSSNPKEVWSYHCNKRTQAPRRLEVSVVLDPGTAMFRVEATSLECDASVVRPTLRRMNVATVGIEPIDIEPSAVRTDETLTEAERDRLEALGYLE